MSGSWYDGRAARLQAYYCEASSNALTNGLGIGSRISPRKILTAYVSNQRRPGTTSRVGMQVREESDSSSHLELEVVRRERRIHALDATPGQEYVAVPNRMAEIREWTFMTE